MHQPLVYLLRSSKERCDEYVVSNCFEPILFISNSLEFNAKLIKLKNLLKMSIGEYKVNKKEKIGILRFVTYFEVGHRLYLLY